MRFVTVGQKAIVVVVLLVVNGVLWLILNPVGWVPGSIALSVLQLAGWYLASRVFRGEGEPVRPVRAWWRMTARPLLSGIWSALYIVGLIASIVALPFVEITAGDVVSLLVQAALGFLFGLSFVRLRRLQQEQQGAQRLATASVGDPQRIRA